jgi:hypothetical protein
MDVPICTVDSSCKYTRDLVSERVVSESRPLMTSLADVSNINVWFMIGVIESANRPDDGISSSRTAPQMNVIPSEGCRHCRPTGRRGDAVTFVGGSIAGIPEVLHTKKRLASSRMNFRWVSIQTSADIYYIGYTKTELLNLFVACT